MRHLSDIKTLSAITVIVAIISSIAQADRVDTQAGITESYCEACRVGYNHLKGLAIFAKQVEVSIPNDPRKELDRIAHPEYNGIGLVKSSLGRGTGFMINECLMLTNKHVIGAGKNIIGNSVDFHAGQSVTDRSKSFEYKVQGTVVASGNQEGERSDDITEDWALVKLNKSVGEKIGFTKIGFAEVEDAKDECESLEIAGFPADKDYKNLWWQGDCKLFPETSGPSAFNIGCPITPGNSGSPLICKRKNKPNLAIGIATQSAIKNENTQSYALNFTVDEPLIAQAIKKNQSCNN